MTKSITSLTDMYIKRMALYVAGEQVYGRLSREFLTTLGCPYVFNNDEFEPVSDPVDAAEIRSSIPRLLAAFGTNAMGRVDVSSLLAGLSRNNCWDECLKSSDSAYLLVHSVLNYITMYDEHFELDILVEKDVCELLTCWLRPPSPWVKIPTVTEVCQHLFGEVWVSLAYCDEDEMDLARQVREQRPPFMRGLCPNLEKETILPLPALQEYET